MKRFLALALAVTLLLVGLPGPLAAAGRQANGLIAGTLKCIDQAVLKEHRVQVRNVNTGFVAGTTQTDSNGNYRFAGLEAGKYVVEAIDSNGKVIATSSELTLTTAGMVLTGVDVVASIGCAAAYWRPSHGRTIGIIVAATAGAGIAGYAATREGGSPSK